jgi:outer membrane lipoprotein-sorting protein
MDLRLAVAVVAVLFATLPHPVSAAALEPTPPDFDAKALAKRAEDNLRSSRTFFEGRMIVESPRLSGPRVVAFRSWEDSTQKRSFIRILEPAKDIGTGFLKLHPNLWMYIPRVERTMRIPPSMMLQSWMGSDFTNDDLVRDSSEIDDYDHRPLGIDREGADTGGRSAYVIEYLPHEDAPVVWGRIVAWIDMETAAPLRQEFYDEEGEKLRVLAFGELRAVEGRMVPHRWSLTPLDKKGHRTEIEIREIRFEADFDDDIFTTRNLKKGR